MADIASRTRNVIADTLSVGLDRVTDYANVIDDLGADSLDTVELVMALEEEFGIEILDDQVDQLSTVRTVIALVTRLAI